MPVRVTVSTFLLVPGAGGVAWYWHRVVERLLGAGGSDRLRDVVQEVRVDVERLGVSVLRAAATRAASQRVFSHHWPGVSPGNGIIALFKTRRRTGSRLQAGSAANAPMDCATRTRSCRPSAAPVTRSAYWGRPAATTGSSRSPFSAALRASASASRRRPCPAGT